MLDKAPCNRLNKTNFNRINNFGEPGKNQKSFQKIYSVFDQFRVWFNQIIDHAFQAMKMIYLTKINDRFQNTWKVISQLYRQKLVKGARKRL
jgi:hypothetical protein